MESKSGEGQNGENGLWQLDAVTDVWLRNVMKDATEPARNTWQKRLSMMLRGQRSKSAETSAGICMSRGMKGYPGQRKEKENARRAKYERWTE